MLVPLVAIDGHGTRLGQGKGHYDRVLANLREHGALLIGIGWQVQKLDATIPAEPWDVPLDGFASPDGLEMFPMTAQPSWRKPAGIFAILALITLWAALIASLSGEVGRWPILVQAIFYLVAGIAWILPLKPLLRWMETGRFRE